MSIITESLSQNLSTLLPSIAPDQPSEITVQMPDIIPEKKQSTAEKAEAIFKARAVQDIGKKHYKTQLITSLALTALASHIAIAGGIIAIVTIATAFPFSLPAGIILGALFCGAGTINAISYWTFPSCRPLETEDEKHFWKKFAVSSLKDFPIPKVTNLWKTTANYSLEEVYIPEKYDLFDIPTEQLRTFKIMGKESQKMLESFIASYRQLEAEEEKERKALKELTCGTILNDTEAKISQKYTQAKEHLENAFAEFRDAFIDTAYKKHVSNLDLTKTPIPTQKTSKPEITDTQKSVEIFNARRGIREERKQFVLLETAIKVLRAATGIFIGLLTGPLLGLEIASFSFNAYKYIPYTPLTGIFFGLYLGIRSAVMYFLGVCEYQQLPRRNLKHNGLCILKDQQEKQFWNIISMGSLKEMREFWDFILYKDLSITSFKPMESFLLDSRLMDPETTRQFETMLYSINDIKQKKSTTPKELLNKASVQDKEAVENAYVKQEQKLEQEFNAFRKKFLDESYVKLCNA